MKHTKTLFAILFSLLLLPFIVGCGGGGGAGGGSSSSASASTGTMSLSITDAPPVLGDNVTGVNISVIGIEYKKDGKWEEAEGFEGPQVYNLLDLQDGNSMHMGDLILPAGHYTELRFKLDAPKEGSNPKNNPGCYITFSNEPPKALFVPSGSSSGFKAKGEFDITADAKIAVTADFNVYKSIVVAGNSGKYLLKPVIRIVVTELSGGVDGTITNIDDFDASSDVLVVYAYEDDTYNISEIDDGFPGSVSGADVDMSTGAFTLSYLEEGRYDLVVVEYAGEQVTKAFDPVENIDVPKGADIAVDINTSTL